MELRASSLRISYFVIGFLIGWFLHWTILTRFRLSPSVEKGLRHSISTYSGLLFVFWREYRCVSLLCLPTFVAKNGRRIIVTFIISILIAGPFSNMTENARSAASTVSCQSKMRIEQSMKHNWLKFIPIKMFMDKLRENREVMNKESIRLQTEMLAVNKTFMRETVEKKEQQKAKDASNTNLTMEERKEVMDRDTSFDPMEDFTKPNQELYEATIMLITGANHEGNLTCKDSLENMEEKDCDSTNKKDRMLNRLCVKGSFRNQTGDEGKKFCDNDIHTQSTFCPKIFRPGTLDPRQDSTSDHVCGKRDTMIATDIPDYKSVISAQKDLNKSMTPDASFNYSMKVEKPEWEVGQQVADRINAMIKKRKQFVEAIRELWNNFVAILLVWTLWTSYKYRVKYLKDIKNDNVYVTQYFHHIDERRRRVAKMTLLPLKELDGRPDIVYPFRKKLNPQEKTRMVSACMIWFVFFVVVSLLLYFDNVLSYLIESFNRHARMTRIQYGYHELRYTVNGTGAVAESMRRILDDLVVRVDLNELVSMDQCLPQFFYTLTSDYLTIVGYFVLWMLLNVTDAYFLRIRRLVCQQFYPTQEKHRILNLYNDLLSTRKKVLSHRLKRALRERMTQIPLAEVVQEQDHTLCKLCNDFPVNGIACAYVNCGAVYCKQCWDFISRFCLVCSTLDELRERLGLRNQQHLMQECSR